MAALAVSNRSMGIALGLGLDPITHKPMVDPVIDQCGHTFDRSTITLLRGNQPEGSDVICPFSQEVIQTNKLVVNCFARDAAPHLQNLESRVTSLENQNKAFQDRLDSLMKSFAAKAEKQKAAKPKMESIESNWFKSRWEFSCK